MVGTDGELLGMVSEVDLLTHLVTADHDHPADESIALMINREVPTASADVPLVEVLPELLSKKVTVLTDELSRPVGILTLIDALEFLSANAKG